MKAAWWGCHWCEWRAPVDRYRILDRWRATRSFRKHLRTEHPEVDYQPGRPS